MCDQRGQQKQQKYTSTEAGLENRKANREVRKKRRQQRKSGLKSSARTWRREWCQKTAKRPTTLLMISPRPNSISHRRQKWKHPDEKYSCSTPGGLSTAVVYTTTNSIQTLAYSRIARPPHKRLKAYFC